MGNFIDLTGKTFGRLTVLNKTIKKGNEWHWNCVCECGNNCEVAGVNLRKGRTRSCGCLKKESDKNPKGNVIDLAGKKFGHLTVLSRDGSDKYGHAKWLCECDCENHTRLSILGDNLKRGHTISCGCERRSRGELAIAKLLTDNNIPFEQEVPIFKFANGTNARFDFYVDKKYLIEYDGETHYQYNLHGWHNKEQLEAQQERDIIKNQWCLDNNIPLIRIPFTILSKLTINDLLLEDSEYVVLK